MKAYVLIINLILANLSLAQVPADSLKGIYIGSFFYSYPAGTSWNVSQDTEYVFSVDTINCWFYADGCMDFSLGGTNVYTDYYSCNSVPPSNYYTKFYSSDSLRIINDTVPQPSPNLPYSKRFYGKRIGPLPIGIKGNKKKEELINVWPNPTSGILKIRIESMGGQIKISIVNALGEEIQKQHKEIQNDFYELDVSELPEGIYLLRIKTEKGILTKKVLVE